MFDKISDLQFVEAGEPDRPLNKSFWLVLFGIALASRIIAGFVLPNAEEDGYSYAERIARLSGLLVTGEFRPRDLFDFWLPLFQFVSGIVNIWVNDPIAAGKIVNVICGATTCVLIFAITRELTRNLILAGLAFVLILLSPLHILYSAACMTDVPHCCLVLASVWFVCRRRWIWAAIFAALAEGVRIEAWALILAIPLLQWLRERRVSVLAVLILLALPLAWFGIGYLATGDPFSYFADRSRYQASYLAFYPSRRGFAFADVSRDATYFLFAANPAVFLGALGAAGIIVTQFVRGIHRFSWGCVACIVYGGALLAALLFAYVTKAQPVLFPRYSLVFFALGMPLFAWVIQLIIRQIEQRWLTIPFVVIALACVWQARAQMPVLFKVVGDFHAHQDVTASLLSVFQESGYQSRCFCDDTAIRVLSRQPLERFVSSATVPNEVAQSPADFEAYLSRERVSNLVFVRKENSLPVKLYPQLGQSEQADTGNFEFVAVGRSSFGADVWLYRLRNARPPR